MGDTDTISREEAGHDGLFLTEAETAHRLGVSKDRWRAARKIYEPQGLPKPDPIMGGRFWPAVLAFFKRRYALDTIPQGKLDGGENLDEL